MPPRKKPGAQNSNKNKEEKKPTLKGAGTMASTAQEEEAFLEEQDHIGEEGNQFIQFQSSC